MDYLAFTTDIFDIEQLYRMRSSKFCVLCYFNQIFYFILLTNFIISLIYTIVTDLNILYKIQKLNTGLDLASKDSHLFFLLLRKLFVSGPFLSLKS